MVEVAIDLGLAAYAPLLPGHGTHARDLARTGWADWSHAAAVALESVAAPGHPAIVAGLSLGSLLAADLAASRPDRCCALVLLATATRLAITNALPLWILDKLGVPDFNIPKSGSDIADPVARAHPLTYGVNPLHSTLEVMRAGQRVERQLLPRISCPVFIAHGALDGVCPVANAARAARLAGSADTVQTLLPRSAHVITHDYDREELRAALRQFLERIAVSKQGVTRPGDQSADRGHSS